MSIVEYFEALMLLCFSISWYWSIAKMISSKVATGKSLQFVLMICVGYTFGIISKILLWQSSGDLSLLIWVYGWNFIVTSFDALLVIYYSRRVLPFVPAQIQRRGLRKLWRFRGSESDGLSTYEADYTTIEPARRAAGADAL